ncbi:HIT family protein [Pseudoalteromonas piscicida]|uniref:HIT family protein n=1 Tax=Pseudoalteromonas piscicida TaxID=43662 RepID=UPI0005FA2049|nr:HIT family protein [Pseudoalteromonas piscicida]KJY97554.1 HIT family hydrolase [Pseudoalteromonas piscicida]
MTIVEQIVARNIEAVIVYESEQVIAFADHDPINFGHILICPKSPYETLLQVPESILAEVHRVARDLYVRIERKFSPDGITLVQNNGHFNELSHYHLHIFPRYKQDSFAFGRDELNIKPQEVLRTSLEGL